MPLRLSPISCSINGPRAGTSPLSLHDALPISAFASASMKRSRSFLLVSGEPASLAAPDRVGPHTGSASFATAPGPRRSEEHTSELQSHSDLVCSLLLQNTNHDLAVRELR